MTKKLHLVSENDSPVNPTEQQRTDVSQETKNHDTKPWVVKVSDISKSFSIYTSDRARVLEFLGNRQHHSKHWALQNCNFDIKKGECFGIMGANGAGKSTMLKLIAGITKPTKGEILLRGNMSTLLDLGVGFHPQFSGRENIKMNCSILGVPQNTIEELIPKIIAFSELGNFIDYPVRTYSAGMCLRLGFSIASHVPSDILLIDEVLTVGDQYFQRKCVQKIASFLEEERTIILVSHDLHSLRSLCDRVLWLENGNIKKIGPAQDIVDAYIGNTRKDTQKFQHVPPMKGNIKQVNTSTEFHHTQYNCTSNDPKLKQAMLNANFVKYPEEHFGEEQTTPFDTVDGDRPIIQGSGEVRIFEVQILDQEGHTRESFETGEDIVVSVSFRTTEPIQNPIFGVAMFRDDNLYIHGPNTKFDRVLEGTYHGVYTFFIRWKEIPLLSGNYLLSIAVFDEHHIRPHIWHNQLYTFSIRSPVEDHGLLLLEHEWGMITHLEEKKEPIPLHPKDEDDS